MNTTNEVAEKNELATLIEKNGLAEETANILKEKFLPFIEQAQEWNEKAKALVVTDATQLTEMKQAREARLALKDIRIGVAKTHQELKADSLKYSQTLDLIKRTLTGMIEPTEEYLQAQEDFPKIQEEKRKEALKASRIELLSPYGIQTDFYDLKNMPEADFKQLLANTIKNQEDRIAAEKKENEERIAREQEEIKERERIRLENEQLRKEKEEREKEIAAKNQLRKERNAILSKYKYTYEADIADIPQKQFESILKEVEADFNEAEKKRIEAEQEELLAKEQREAELRAEREALEEKEERMIQILSERGFVLSNNDGYIEPEQHTFSRDGHSISRKELIALPEGSLVEKLNLIDKAVSAEKELAAKKEAEEQAKREAEEREQAELSMGDKAKFQKLIDEMEALKGKYAFKSKKYKALGESVDELIGKTISWAKSKQ